MNMNTTKNKTKGRVPYASGNFARESELLAKVQEEQAQAQGKRELPDMDEHDPLLAAYNGGDGDQRDKGTTTGLPWIVETRLIVASVNNAAKLAKALRKIAAIQFNESKVGLTVQTESYHIAIAALAAWEAGRDDCASRPNDKRI